MKFILFLFLFIFLINNTICQLLTTFNLPKFNKQQGYRKNSLNDRQLLLTPFIEAGREDLARKYAKVDSKHFFNVTSYSGYFTVDEKYNSNLFFWFFPAEGTENEYDLDDINFDYDGIDEIDCPDGCNELLKKLVKKNPNLINNKDDKIRLDKNDKPVLLWLQGGPGVSSLFALFTENGPFFIDPQDELSIIENPFSWHKNYSILFIDNPVGTGFSFTDKNGYCSTITQTAKHLHKGLVQFFKMFPNLQANEFYITGESFAGKYIPAIGYEIYEQNSIKDSFKINLQGLLLGNALSDPYNMIDYSDFAYQLGLIGPQGYREMKVTETLLRFHYNDSKVAKAYWDSTLYLFSKHSHYNNLYDIHDPESMDLFPFKDFVEQPHIRKALHVGKQQFADPTIVYSNLLNDFMTTAIHWTEKLLNSGLKIMYYNGNWDFIVAYPLSENAHQKMKWNGSDKYRTAKREPFYVNGKLKAHVTKADNFYDVAVLNAGHMVPTDQPEAMLKLLDDFIKNKL